MIMNQVVLSTKMMLGIGYITKQGSSVLHGTFQRFMKLKVGVSMMRRVQMRNFTRLFDFRTS